MKIPMLALDAFCLRQFTASESLPQHHTYFGYTPEDFLRKCNEYVEEHGTSILRPGYAPFCKHIFVPNFTAAHPQAVVLDAETEKCVKTKYEARTEKELPVLVRYIPAELLKLQPARYLDIILYSREQVMLENREMGNEVDESNQAPWWIVSIKAQDEEVETPMIPITMLRNA
uniref:Aspartyl/glutamyl-tRNA(Asn/Gln) amidotransferase subunit B n=2 Tax=Lygus hesperus TaxID=30085 RepID=A0A0A9Z1I7_LYGHE